MYAYATEDSLKDIVLRLFIDAFYHFSLNEYQIIAIKAQTACEYSLTCFLKEEHAQEKAATYYKKLHTIFPNIIKKHYPILNETISVSLDQLRFFRSQIVHEGLTPVITQTEAAAYLQNAFLLYKYLHLVKFF